MRIGDLFSHTKNKKNNQEILSLRKKKLKKAGLSIDDFLKLKIPRKKW